MKRPKSLSEIAERAVAEMQPFDAAVREFLDASQFMDDAAMTAAMADAPLPVGPVEDAYLAALAEHLAQARRLSVPAWSEQPRRFLKEPFFAGGLESLKAALIVESPAAFRRRLIFIGANALSRPRRQFERDPSPGTR